MVRPIMGSLRRKVRGGHEKPTRKRLQPVVRADDASGTGPRRRNAAVSLNASARGGKSVSLRQAVDWTYNPASHSRARLRVGAE